MEKTETLCQQWNAVCGQLQQELGDSLAIRWLTKFVPTRLENNQLHLMAPSPCIKELIKKNYGHQILSLFQLQNPAITDVKFGLKSSGCNTKTVSMTSRIPPAAKQTSVPAQSVQQNETTQPSTVTPQCVAQKIVDADGEVVSSYLDPSHTFDSFVVGPSNAFAYNAAKRIAEEKDISFNPLYLHSSVGLGKTHLMHAIAWRIQDMHPGKSVLYLSAEQFFHRFVKAIRTHSTENFRNLFRSVDVLMIDDVQFIFGKKTTQEEFFHTFNALISNGKKIILSADSAPADLAGIEERLKTRIAQGLVVDIHPTCYDLRFGILKDKVTQKGLTVPHDVLDFLAKRVTSNIRELEGALNRIIAHSQWMGSQINLETVHRILKDVLRINERVVHITDIQRMTADFYGLSVADLKSTRRERRIARPRQLAMYMAKQMTTLSVPDIAAHFGRDHTTIMHAVKQIEILLERDHKLGQDMQTLMYRLKEGDNE